MKQNLTKFFNLIKQDKQAKTLTIIGILLLFIFTLGYSLSAFTGNKNSNVANIKVNDLSFNITTNGATSDDRVLHLKANKMESFNVIITNLNKIDTKYELIYDVCSDSKCTSLLNNLPNKIKVEYLSSNSDELNGTIASKNDTKKINLLTTNDSENDVYIRLNLNAGYTWNELELANQINEVISLDKDIDIIAYVDGVEVKDLPSTCFYEATSTAYKNNAELTDSNVSLSCNYATGKWDIILGNVSLVPDKLIIDFKDKAINAVEYITTLQNKDSENSNGLFIDPTSDKNIRYTGSNPKNYVEFGNDGELWRIVGIFNVTDSSGVKSKKIKLVRDESLGEYSWDASYVSSYGDYRGKNDWTNAHLQKELNGDYLNYNLTSNTNWVMSKDYSQKYEFSEFEYSKTIKEKYQKLISESVWNLGGNELTGSEPYYLPAIDQYNAEKGTSVYGGNKTTWTGKVALLYASDLGYASTNQECRNNLRAGIVYKNNKWDYSDTKCRYDNWLENDKYVWTISTHSTHFDFIYVIDNDSTIIISSTYNSFETLPSLYLNSNVEFASGTGEKETPYKLSL